MSWLFHHCKKKKFTISNLNQNKITLLGHGGMGIGKTYPLNSYESISKCLNSGADGSEMDVQLTKDSVLVAFHDKDLSVNTNMSGIIHSFTRKELKETHYDQTPYLNYSIVSLEELFFNTSQPQSFTFTFDLKLHSGGDPGYLNQFINQLILLIDKYKLADKACIESKDENFLKLLQSKRPQYHLFINSDKFETALNSAQQLSLYGITLSTREVSKSQMQIAHEKNIRVALWNVHTKKDNQEAVEKNPDYIQTDELNHLINLLNRN